ncbi:hypothetical protein ACYZTL_15560 [Pseudomonas sp. LB3P81]
MLIVFFWLASLIACIFYGAGRIHRTYKSEQIDRHENYKNGFALIIYSVLIVGVSGFLGASIMEYQLSLPEASYLWIGISEIADLTKYLAPFVFAAIGVNLVSHAMTS